MFKQRHYTQLGKLDRKVILGIEKPNNHKDPGTQLYARKYVWAGQ